MHTAYEPGMWRAWLRNGQSLEVTWWRTPVGMKIGIHSNDDSDDGDRHLWIGLGFVQAFIPLGVVAGPYDVGEEPGWGATISREHIWARWGRRSRFIEWPFRTITLGWDYECEDGSWRSVRDSGGMVDGDYVRRPGAKIETHPYAYRLRSGEVQHRKATILRERREHGRNLLHRLGWPKSTKYSIDIWFDGEVGERSCSWKGGTIGCGYSMLDGETPLQTLRRMERERVFN